MPLYGKTRYSSYSGGGVKKMDDCNSSAAIHSLLNII